MNNKVSGIPSDGVEANCYHVSPFWFREDLNVRRGDSDSSTRGTAEMN